jgi:hypothetical protein
MDEIPADLVRVDPRVASALGLTIEEIKGMGLRELAERAFDRGYEWSVSTKKAEAGEGHLTIRMDAPGFLNLTSAA